jgi:hypothetical protein
MIANAWFLPRHLLPKYEKESPVVEITTAPAD